MKSVVIIDTVKHHFYYHIPDMSSFPGCYVSNSYFMAAGQRIWLIHFNVRYVKKKKILYITNLQVVNISYHLLSESSEKRQNAVLFVKSLRFYMSPFQHEAKWEIIISFGNNLQIQIAVLLLREIQTTGKLHRACQDSAKIRPIILRLHLWWQWSQAKPSDGSRMRTDTNYIASKSI